MALKKLLAEHVGLPRHLKMPDGTPAATHVNLFDLSSHAKLKSVICFGLKLRRDGFHIFVMGDERTGRMPATMSCLRELTAQTQPAKDWVYLNNFKVMQRPFAFSLEAGLGVKLKGQMTAILSSIQTQLIKSLEGDQANDLLRKASSSLEDDFSQKVNELANQAHQAGFDLLKTPEGEFIVTPRTATENKKKSQDSQTSSEQVSQARSILDQMSAIARSAHMAQEALLKQVKDERSQMAKQIISTYVDDLYAKFDQVVGFYDWVQLLKKDMLSRFEDFLEMDDDQFILTEDLKLRYAVNVLVDHSNQSHMPIHTVSHPSYENLFGSIKYRGGENGVETDFTLIQPGALHKANGGVLVIQAEALAGEPQVWGFLKRALQDRKIRIEEFHRQNGTPMMQAPDPQSIPLDIQIVLVGAPWWFDDFFIPDPEFRSHFKVRAEIDLTMPACEKNVRTYRALIQQWSQNHLEMSCDEGAISELMGHSARWANHRGRLSGRFELVGDMLKEARVFAQERDAKLIEAQDIKSVFIHRQKRKSAGFLSHVEEMLEKRQHVETQGHVIGQINALTVLTSIESSFGTPSRLTARTFAAKEGVVSIERSIEMSGAIQDKGIMILTGFLNGLLGQHFPLSFGASLTFEQLYVPIDGDSASLAELLALLSSLSDLPIAQHMAVTGAIDQFGNIQAVGGLHEKIEGYYAVCKARGLTGEQGVVLPETNWMDLCLSNEVEESIRKGEFHLWTVAHVADAVQLMLGHPLGESKPQKKAKADGVPVTVLDRVHKKLAGYVKLMKHD